LGWLVCDPLLSALHVLSVFTPPNTRFAESAPAGLLHHGPTQAQTRPGLTTKTHHTYSSYTCTIYLYSDSGKRQKRKSSKKLWFWEF
jgi:hypothetical protein